MQANRYRHIKNGSEYDGLFPLARMSDETVKRGAKLEDTVYFIPKAVEKTRWQTVAISDKLKGKDVYETCKNIWDFLYEHVRYKKDEDGLEQIRSPRRLWKDRFKGVDCDCYTTTICTILLNCGIKPKDIQLRITKYKEDRFQHIYPIVFSPTGSYIVIDCVVDEFNYEEPYTEKKDFNMDLQFLDGMAEETDGLGKIKIFAKIGTAVKKAANVVNKVNPATVLLRAGLLASMKLNLMKVAGRLRWAYLTEEQAKQKGIIIDRYHKLKEVMKKLENIFFTAGGKPENLKNAILTGKGNQDKQVLAGIGMGNLSALGEDTPLPLLLGADVYHSEIMDGIDSLGEPVTAASIAAASAALATIATLIKNIGDIFPKGNKLNESGDQEGNPATDQVNIDTEVSPAPSAQTNSPVLTVPSGSAATKNANNGSQNTESSSESITTDENKKEDEGFWKKNKKWLVPTLWGVGGVGVIVGLYKAFGGKKKEEPKKLPENKPVSGVKRGKSPKKNTKKIKSVALR